MCQHIGIYPILGVTPDHLDEPFDLLQLPIEILAGVTIEDTKPLFKPDSFDTWKGFLAKRELEALQRVRFGIVNRYEPFDPVIGSSSGTEKNAEAIVRYLAGCLRLIRPMQQDASYIRGRLLLYELRNCVAHGDKVPARFFQPARSEYGDTIVLAEMLSEAASRIVRGSLMKILEENLLDHFLDSPTSEAFFGAQGLTRRVLREKKRGTF